MNERKGLATMGGKPVTLEGNEVKEGDKAPDFTVVGADLSEVKSSEFEGKVRLISVVTSLDTSVCDLQTHRFNEEAAGLGKDVVILTVSMDLPFAQKRWCGASGIDKIKVYSDHKYASFGTSYGVLMRETRLLARSIFVVDKEGTIRYSQIVKEVGEHPDYEAALKAVKELANR
jgi:thiol peroxidase